NDIVDTFEKAIIDEILRYITIGQTAQKSAQAHFEKMWSDGIISQDETLYIVKRNVAIKAATDGANVLLKQLPDNAESNGETKQSLQEKVNAINTVEIPKVNDINNDRKLDTPKVISLTIDADKNANRRLDSPEWLASKGKTSVTINLSNDVGPGDRISYQVGSSDIVSRKLSLDEIETKRIVISNVALPDQEGGVLKVWAHIDVSDRTGVKLDKQPIETSIMYDMVSSAPVGKDQLVETIEDSAYQFSRNSFTLGMTDPMDFYPNNFTGITIDSLVTSGELFLDKNGDGVFNHTDTLVRIGDVIASSDLAQLTYISGQNFSGKDSFTFKVMDDGITSNGGSNIADKANTMYINISPKVEANTSFTIGSKLINDGSGQANPKGTGWWQTAYQITPKGTRIESQGIKDHAKIEDIIESFLRGSDTPVRNEQVMSVEPQLSGYNFNANNFTVTKTGGNASLSDLAKKHSINSAGVESGQGQKTSGLVYLKEGQTVVFRYFADDHFQINLGGKVVVQDKEAWNGTQSNGYLVQESGYYTVEMFVYNRTNGNGTGQVGAQVVEMSLDNGRTFKKISTENFDLYKNAVDLFSDNHFINPKFKQAEGATNDGYYTAHQYTNIGYIDNKTQKSNAIQLSFSVQSNDRDGSEQLANMKLSFDKIINKGVVLSDGLLSYTFKGNVGEEIDVMGWNLDNLTLGAGVNAGAYQAILKTTWQDSAELYDWNAQTHSVIGSKDVIDTKEMRDAFDVKIYNPVIDLGNRGNEIQITLQDLIDNTSLNKLYITGGKSDTVDLGRNGTLGNPSSGELFKDSEKSGSWRKGVVITDEFGVKFDTYTHDNNRDEILYIQQGITVI
ncbi:GA-like domain-containing protein, partial [Moraxella canis]